MEIEIPKCKNCERQMIEIGGIGRAIQLGEYRKQENSDFSIFHQTGVREQKLYQCSECKKVEIY